MKDMKFQGAHHKITQKATHSIKKRHHDRIYIYTQNRRIKHTTKKKCKEKRKKSVIHVYPNWTKEQNHMGNHLVPYKKMARAGNKRRRIGKKEEKRHSLQSSSTLPYL